MPGRGWIRVSSSGKSYSSGAGSAIKKALEEAPSPPDSLCGFRAHYAAPQLRGRAADAICGKVGEKKEGYTEIPCFLAAFFNCSSAVSKSLLLTNCSNSS